MVNTYTYTGPGERWSLTDPTAVDFLNVSRVNVDHVYEALNTLMDTDAADGVLLGSVDASGLVSGTVSAGVAVSWTSNRYTSTDQNGLRVIFVDLDDPDTMWDYERYLQHAQGTEWHNTYGDPPVHGLMFVTADGNKVVWWDREAGSAYRSYSSSTLGPVYSSGGLEDLDFLDGVIVACDGVSTYGAAMVDTLEDMSYLWHTGGLYTNFVDLSSTATFVVLNSGLAIVNAQVSHVGICRDPELLDAFDRPRPWLALGTAGGHSVVKPVHPKTVGNKWTVYDHGTGAHFGSRLTPSGVLSRILDSGGTDWYSITRDVHTIGADTYGHDMTWSGTNHVPWSPSDQDVGNKGHAVAERGSWAHADSPVLWMGSPDAGILVHHCVPDEDDNPSNLTKRGVIRLHEDYSSPYMKGYIQACWPLHSVSDVSTSSANDLTNNGSITFSNGGPVGSYCSLNGSTQYFSVSIYNTTVSEIHLAGWFRVQSGNNGYIVSCQQTTPGHYLDLLVDSAASQGKLRVRSGYQSSSFDASTTGTYDDGQWHHFCVNFIDDWETVSPGSSMYELWVDGNRVLANIPTAMSYLTLNRINIGREASAGSNYFTGDVAGITTGRSIMLGRECMKETARGRRKLQLGVDTNDTIPDNNIAAISLDRRGGYVAVASDDKKVTVMDDLVVPVAQHTYQGTTLHDVAIKSMPGSPDYHLAMIGSDELEVIQANTRL